MTSHDPSATNQFLDGIEAVGKVFRIFHGRHVTTHLSQALGKSTTAQSLVVEREVDMIERAVLVVDHYR